jgi:hypothetical protein
MLEPPAGVLDLTQQISPAERRVRKLDLKELVTAVESLSGAALWPRRRTLHGRAGRVGSALLRCLLTE